MGKVMSSFFVYDRLLEERDICNYLAETKRLTVDVEAGRCIRLYGRRNFGKTSIVKNVVAKRWAGDNSKRVVIYIDFLSIETLDDLSAEFTKSFNFAMSKRRGLVEMGVEWFKVLTRVRPTWSPPTSSESFGEFSLKTESGQSVVSFQVVLENIANLQLKKNFEFLIIMDEFQEISKIGKAEAQLRDSLQKLSSDIPVVILGSKQHLLANIFNRPKAPFFSWGLTLELKPIPYEEYHEYISKRLGLAGKTISLKVSQKIQNLLNRIPESVNRFCDFLADQESLKVIQLEDVDSYLEQFLELTVSVYSTQFAAFTFRERLILRALAAREYTARVLSSDFLSEVGGISKSGVEKIVGRLMDDATIYRDCVPGSDEEGYFLADPLLRLYIVKYKILK